MWLNPKHLTFTICSRRPFLYLSRVWFSFRSGCRKHGRGAVSAAPGEEIRTDWSALIVQIYREMCEGNVTHAWGLTMLAWMSNASRLQSSSLTRMLTLVRLDVSAFAFPSGISENRVEFRVTADPAATTSRFQLSNYLWTSHSMKTQETAWTSNQL